MIRTAILYLGLAGVLAVPNALIYHKERLLAEGTTVLLPLAPVDPRSLMQGDYMRLRYAMSNELRREEDWPPEGVLVLRVDEALVGHFVRRHQPGTALGSGEHLLGYRRRSGFVRLGAEAFYFQEGDADVYAKAKYGEVKLSDGGEAILIGLRDETRQALHARH